MTAPYELRPVGYLESPLVDRETAPKQGVGWHDLAGGHALLQPDQLQSKPPARSVSALAPPVTSSSSREPPRPDGD